MQYLGSKNKISKHILPIMLKERGDRVWVEPFVGGANVIDKVQGSRIGNDNHYYLIELLKALQKGWVPPTEVSKELYYDVKLNKEQYSSEMIGFVGFLCSFGGKWWGGYAYNTKGDNYADRGSRVLVKQAKNLKNITFTFGDYFDMVIPDNSLIYCDPPYANTTKYHSSFDHKIFWQWCRDRVKENHIVFVSEYIAPIDFECIISIPMNTFLNKNIGTPRVEKLFVKYK